jgi:hypothetical protein
VGDGRRGATAGVLEYKKGKLSLVSEQINLKELEMTFERIEGFPKDSGFQSCSSGESSLVPAAQVARPRC